MNCTSKTELRPDCRILIAEPNLGLAIAGAVSCLHKSHSLSAQVPILCLHNSRNGRKRGCVDGKTERSLHEDKNGFEWAVRWGGLTSDLMN